MRRLHESQGVINCFEVADNEMNTDQKRPYLVLRLRRVCPTGFCFCCLKTVAVNGKRLKVSLKKISQMLTLQKDNVLPTANIPSNYECRMTCKWCPLAKSGKTKNLICCAAHVSQKNQAQVCGPTRMNEEFKIFH